MKITFIHAYYGTINRGIERWIRDVTDELRSRDLMYTVFVSGAGIPEDHHVVSCYKSFKPISPRFWPRRLVDRLSPTALNIAAFTLRTLLKPEIRDSDVIIASNGLWQFILLNLAKKLHLVRAKTVWINHGSNTLPKDIFVVRPDVFVCLSPELFKRVSTSLPRGMDVRLIANGVNVNFFNPNGTKKEVFFNGLPTVICVSALEAYKRVDRVIQAVSSTGANLLVIGDGTLRYEILEQGRTLLGERFIHILKLNPEDMPEYYRGADLLVHAADNTEAFGLVKLEALACNIPVVTYADEVSTWLIGNAGVLLTETGDVTQLTHAIEEGLKRDWGTIPVEQAHKFSVHEMVSHYVHLFEELV